MKRTLSLPYLAVAGLSGLLFGAGLYISQMVDPLKVLRFLDFGAIPEGGWDPSLGFVMVTAIGFMLIGLRVAGRRAAPLFDVKFHNPEFTHIDTPLVLGAVLFGVGWGMSGLCPGPAITLIAFLPENLWIFLGMTFVGSFIGHYVQKALVARAQAVRT